MRSGDLSPKSDRSIALFKKDVKMVAHSATILLFMKWNYQICSEIALSFESKKDFRTKASGAFQWLRRNKSLDKACAHMKILRRDWADEEIFVVASKYESRRSFKLGDQPAYAAAWKRGILDVVCAHMPNDRYRLLSDEQITAIAGRFKSRVDFLKGDSAAYGTADRRGILDEVCSHMDSRCTRRLSNKEILTIAKQFTARNDFKLGDFGAYTTAIRRGIILEACAHMEYGAWGFREDKPAVLYQFRMELPDGAVLFKVGITNRKPSQRLATMGVPRDTKTTLTATIEFPSGRDARIAEKRLHRRFASYRYNGERLMKNGNTELFTRAMLDH